MRVLVTGAARAIGRATVEVLTDRGHEVVATARDVSLLAGLATTKTLSLDVSDPESVRRAVAEAGELDAVVNNAGLTGHGPLESYPLDSLARVLDVNTLGPLRMAQAVVPRWRERGSGVLVNISLGTGKDRDAAGGRLRRIEARSRGAVGDPALRARALRDPGGHH